MIDTNTRIYLCFQQSARWLGCTLDLSITILMICTTFVIISFSNRNNSSTVGIALLYMVQLSALLQWCVRLFAEVENFMTSVERINEYVDLPIEGETVTKTNDNNNTSVVIDKKDKYWLKEGLIEFSNVCASYRSYLPNVLNNVNLKIYPGEKIGIVGRTGSGKSTLFLTIFRLLEINSGNIKLDNINIKTLTLKQLRSNISILPQEPILFTETIRYNIDPFNEYKINISKKKMCFESAVSLFKVGYKLLSMAA